MDPVANNRVVSCLQRAISRRATVASPIVQCLILLAAVVLHLVLAFTPMLLMSGPHAFLRPHAIVLGVVLTVFMLVESGLQQAGCQAPTRSPGLVDRRARGWSFASGVTLLALVWLGTVTAAPPDETESSGWLRCLSGAILAISGVSLRGCAIWSLGSDFRTEIEITAEQTLRRSGIYGWLRHPSESGLMMIALGIALVLGSGPAALIAILGLLPLSALRIRNEEQQLLAAFGNEYREYARRVPGLW